MRRFHRIACLCGVICISLACSDKTATESAESVDGSHKTVVHRFIDACRQSDLDQVQSLLTPETVDSLTRFFQRANASGAELGWNRLMNRVAGFSPPDCTPFSPDLDAGVVRCTNLGNTLEFSVVSDGTHHQIDLPVPHAVKGAVRSTAPHYHPTEAPSTD